MVTPQEFDFYNIRGISKNQLQQHYQLYLGYIDLLAEVISTLEEEQSNYEYRGLKDGETYALNGIKLHELYFTNLGQTNSKPSSKLLKLIKRDFGSYQHWLNDFIRTGKVARGWAVLAFDYRDHRLHNIMQDTHNQGSLWVAKPLLVLDVYEHAYMIDFGINKAKYLKIFQDNINWSVVNDRVEDINKVAATE